MNVQSEVKAGAIATHLVKVDPASPALAILGTSGVAIKAGTIFRGRTFEIDTPVVLPAGGLLAGHDYAALAGERLQLVLAHSVDDINDPLVIGGFHYAPGGNAAARSGGDDVPAINPYSVWDRNFRPACADPRGMALIEAPHGHRFWSDIYLLGVNHVADGTSRFGVTIADGATCPINPATGKPFKALDYETAIAVLAHHGKQVPSLEEFFALAIGVTEKTAAEDDPVSTKLDAARTSKFGIMQATGNMWVWGHDGDPDQPRTSLFGGSFWHDDYAGSRYARLDCWPGNSNEIIGARGRSDHLQLV